ncbi:MAG: hypothetical protein KDD25_03195, partial [Bdellovibrionales bacterium]|nr:hypothetical protein [Bdellovibrionales bacterium]
QQKALASRVLREFRDSLYKRSSDLNDPELRTKADEVYSHLLRVLNEGVGQIISGGASKCVSEFDASLTPEIFNLLSIASSVMVSSRTYTQARNDILTGMERILQVDSSEAKERLQSLINQCDAFVQSLLPKAA